MRTLNAVRRELAALDVGTPPYRLRGLKREELSLMGSVALNSGLGRLHRIQQAMHERVMFAPIVEPAFLNGIGPRVDEAGLGLITGHLYSAPYEDLRIKPGRR